MLRSAPRGPATADVRAAPETPRAAPRSCAHIDWTNGTVEYGFCARCAGRPVRILTVVDQWSRHSPLLEVAARQSGQTVGETLDRVLEGRERPRSITVDHGTEFQSRALEDWAYRRGVQLDFIRLGKPVENVFIESFNGRLQDACLNVHQFTSLADGRATIEAWRLDDNQHRPHSSLGHLTPNEFAKQRQVIQTAERPPLQLQPVS